MDEEEQEDQKKIDLRHNPLGNCKQASDYKKINRIGEGTYGFVYRAKHRVTNEVVALKRIILHHVESEGFPLTSIREVRALKRCQRHPSIVKLHDVVVGTSRDAVFLLFEYCEHDLYLLQNNFKHPFRESEVKRLVLQLLSAVEFLHKNWIIHRDIKLSNLLYNNKGQLKLADFGLARFVGYPSNELLTPTVVTLWYRAPEVLLGEGQYGFPIDLWSVGCVLGELLLNEAVLQSNSELEQIFAIFKLLGCPNERIWPELTNYKIIKAKTIDLVALTKRFPYNTLRDKFPVVSEEGLDLLQLLFTYRPSLRITARNALRHQYFHMTPFPKDEELMPTFPTLHDEMLEEEEANKAKEQQQQQASSSAAVTVAARSTSAVVGGSTTNRMKTMGSTTSSMMALVALSKKRKHHQQ